jgi:crotonobetainyl-CoA:carnitine CoA-transferase CaiB-like acyl-CoA transferase
MLESMKVVSFCHILQGPAGTQYLADMGADVIKIEPLRGDGSRKWAGAQAYPGGVSAFYLSAARNKKSVAIDLKSKEGMEIVWKLIANTDVVVENFRSGVMERLGMSYEAMQAVNPSVIFASGTGWGRRGPMVGREGQDMLMQARSGLIRATGTERPTAVGAAVVDQHGGALLAMGVMAAFIRKQATGQGCRVESSLFGAALDLQNEPLAAYLSGKRPGTDHFDREANLASWYHFAPYGVYELKDAWIAMPAQDPVLVADIMGIEALKELAQADAFHGRNEFAKAFAPMLKQMTLQEVSDKFAGTGVWLSKVYDYEDVANDPQTEAMNAFREVDVRGEKATLVNHPIRYDDKVPELHTLPISIGEHTEEVLGTLGYSSSQVQDLAERGIVGTPERNNVLGISGPVTHEAERQPKREANWAR